MTGRKGPLGHRLARLTVKDESGCWLWQGKLNADGYGSIRDEQGRIVGVHRASYALAYGLIPAGLDIDHLCRVRHCVNPAHLEAVTHRENTLRGKTLAAMNHNKTHCIRGHEFNDENTLRRRRGHRACRVCVRMVRAGEVASTRKQPQAVAS